MRCSICGETEKSNPSISFFLICKEKGCGIKICDDCFTYVFNKNMNCPIHNTLMYVKPIKNGKVMKNNKKFK